GSSATLRYIALTLASRSLGSKVANVPIGLLLNAAVGWVSASARNPTLGASRLLGYGLGPNPTSNAPQKLSVAAPALMRSCITLEPATSTPSMGSFCS